MYAVSSAWNELIAGDHWFEYSVAFGNTTADNGYKGSSLISVSVEYSLFNGEQPTVGGCLSGELSLSMFKPNETIPRMAKVRPYVRVTDGTTYSEWIPQGVFFIDTREYTKNGGDEILNITAYDAMLKTEADYPSTSHAWPTTDYAVVQDIATSLGVGIDPRTTALMDKAYSIGLPAGYSMREVLSNIASMYAGNWIINYDGELLLVAINGIPPETNYLITAASEPITFGGDHILV